MDNRTCTTCGTTKPASEFAPTQKCCRACSRTRNSARWEASKRWIDEFARQWRQSAGGVIDSAKVFVEQQGRGRKSDGPPDAYYRLRHDATMAYGGYRCACCGEGEPTFLTIDHIQDGGTRHRRELGGSKKVVESLRKRGFPPGYQVLCSNCNQGKHRNGGTCPHKTRQRDT